ncbi:hypothetical protein WY02_25320 [Pseudonocardia sp. AL041005-10]|nr:hypothetical protein [Pseudonocardia sp. AL041005-10]ALE81155.1 hypothetical protein WY02_25320 [Pseudonocardia sp. AL041005-10]
MGEHVRLDRAQPGAGIDSQLVGEQATGAGQHGQRVGLSAGAVQRDGQQPDRVLAQRVLPHQRRQVRDDGVGPAQPQPRPGPPLERDLTQLVEAFGLGARPGGVGELGVGGTVPQRQGLAQQGVGPVRCGRGGAVEEVGEGARIEPVGAECQRVAGWAADQHRRDRPRGPVGFEHPSQPGDVDLQPAVCLRGRGALPQVLHQRVDGDDLAAGRGEPGEQLAAASGADLDRRAAGRHTERAEDPDRDLLHPGNLGPGDAGVSPPEVIARRIRPAAAPGRRR